MQSAGRQRIKGAVPGKSPRLTKNWNQFFILQFVSLPLILFLLRLGETGY
jgi:hypothetical protein